MILLGILVGVVASIVAGGWLEWRLHRSRSATVNEVRVVVSSAVREGVSEAVAEAMRRLRQDGSTIDSLSEHVGMLEDDMDEVRKVLNLERRTRTAQALAALENGLPKPPGQQAGDPPASTTPTPTPAQGETTAT